MKARVKATGNIIDVSQGSSIITSKGVEKQYFDNDSEWNFYLQSELEFIHEKPQKDIDWEERRYEIAKAMMAAFERHNNNVSGFKNPTQQAQYALECADALIAELKKGGEK